MNKTSSKVIGTVTGALMLAGTGIALATPVLTGAPSTAGVTGVEANTDSGQSAFVKVAHVEGAFSFGQNKIVPISKIASVFRSAANALCSSPSTSGDQGQQAITVESEGQQPFTATPADIAAEDGSVNYILACSCSGNVPGGGAIVNTEVSGVSLSTIAGRAGAL